MPIKASLRNFTIKKCQGFTLIEALIAVVVLAIGLLGLAGLQATSLKNNQSAYNRSQATQLAYDMADRIRTNSIEAVKFAAGEYAATTAAVIQASCNNTTGCLPALMAQNDRAQWHVNIRNTLPSGVGSITADTATRTFTITINWDDNRDGDIDNSDPNFQMSFSL